MGSSLTELEPHAPFLAVPLAMPVKQALSSGAPPNHFGQLLCLPPSRDPQQSLAGQPQCTATVVALQRNERAALIPN